MLESLSMPFLPDLSFSEMNAVPLTCWQDLCLSKIWIPGRLLTNRQKPLNTWVRISNIFIYLFILQSYLKQVILFKFTCFILFCSKHLFDFSKEICVYK